MGDRTFDSERVEEARNQVSRMFPTLSRPEENPVKVWLLLSGKREHVIFVLALFIFSGVFLFGILNPDESLRLFTETDTVESLFTTLLSGVILLVSIVVSINSVAITQEIGSLGMQQERVEQSQEFRKALQNLLGEEQGPTNPADFLQSMLQEISEQASQLQEAAASHENDRFEQAVDEYVRNDILPHIRRINEQFAGQPVGLFDVLLAGLSYNHAEQLQTARQINETFSDTLEAEDQQALTELIETFEYFAVGHNYFKALYYKQEVSDLSSMLLYTSLPAILIASYVLLAFSAGLIPDITVLRISPLLIFISLTYALLLVPFVVLTVYTLRIATITKRTLAAGPFLLKTRDRHQINWEEMKGMEL